MADLLITDESTQDSNIEMNVETNEQIDEGNKEQIKQVVISELEFPTLGNPVASKINTSGTSFTSIISSSKNATQPKINKIVPIAAKSNQSFIKPSTVTPAVQSNPNELPESGIAIAKSVLSGDTIILRGKPLNGPPPEIIFTLSSINVPRIGQYFKVSASNDEYVPLSYEAREFLRINLIGKEVKYICENKPSPSSNREYGYMYVKDSIDGYVNINKLLLAKGFGKLRKSESSFTSFSETLKAKERTFNFNISSVINDLDYNSFVEAENNAKSAKLGVWYDYSEEDTENENENKLSKNLNIVNEPLNRLPLEELSGDSMRNFFNKFKGYPVHAILEHVRDGSSYRILIPSSKPDKIPSLIGYVLLSGVKAPSTGNKDTTELFAEQSKFYVESRLLQREIQFIPEAIVNDTLIGTVKAGSINLALALLCEGLVQIQEWGLNAVTEDSGLYKQAEDLARKENKNLFNSDNNEINSFNTNSTAEFDAIITRIISADSFIVEKPNGEQLKVFLASVRAPKSTSNVTGSNASLNDRNNDGSIKEFGLDFEAKDFMRSKYIGKKCHVKVDYIRPANQGYEAKLCGTVYSEGKNIAVVGILKGFLDLVRYRKDDDERSSEFLALSTAFDAAKNRKKGIHSVKPYTPFRVVDASVKATKAKQYFPFLQRAGSLVGIVDYITSGSRYRVYIPSQNCIITLVLAGIRTPRSTEPYGDEALELVQKHFMQRDVEIEVYSTDNTGGFLGSLKCNNINPAKLLVNAGLAYVLDRGLKQDMINELKDIENQVVDKKVVAPPPKIVESDVKPNYNDDDYSDDDY